MLLSCLGAATPTVRNGGDNALATISRKVVHEMLASTGQHLDREIRAPENPIDSTGSDSRVIDGIAFPGIDVER